MPMPTQQEMVDPLLIELLKSETPCRPKDLYDKVAAHFPNMTQEERHEELANWGTNKFNNRVQWARQSLVTEGLIDNSIRGRWTLTSEGRNRAERLMQTPLAAGGPVPTSPPKLLDLIDAHEFSVRDVIRMRLQAMDPYQFEELAGRLLRAMGFRDVVVTQKSADGGVDGHGRLRVGIVTVNAAFQCKRWRDRISRPQIDQFRGATQGRFDQAILMTTSSFSDNAIAESIRPGVIPVILVDGAKMIDLMIQNEIGTTRKPLLIPNIDEAFFEDLAASNDDDENVD